MLTADQVRWAASHDWFYCDKGDGTILVVDRYTQKHADGSITSHEDSVHWTKSFQELRNWAGY